MASLNKFQRPEEFNPRSTDNPATPADRAREVWDARVGKATVQAYNWRRATILLCVVCLVLTCGLV